MVHSILQKVNYELNAKKKSPDQIFINVPRTLIQLRAQRPMMIQTDGQYEFCYLAIYDGITRLIGSKYIQVRRATSHYHRFPNSRFESV